MNTLRFCCLTLLTMTVFGLTSCATESDPYKGLSEGAIFTQSQAALQKGRYDQAVSAFEALEAKYPYGQYAHVEQLNIIYAYYMSQNYVSAQASAERYIHLNPQGRYVDYAYYMQAMSLFAKERSFLENYFPVDPAERDLSPIKQSFDAFNYVLQNYPQSPYAADARLHMVYIRNMFARNDLQTATYYYTRSAYLAALNNARNVVFHYQKSPVVGDALVMMYHCYQQLKLTKDAETTLKIIEINYPELYKKLKK